MSDFVLEAAKPNGVAILAGSTGAGVFPGFERERGRVRRTVRMVVLWALRSRVASGAGGFPPVYCHPRVRPIDGWMAYRGSQYLVLL